jgi:hypothetical protein
MPGNSLQARAAVLARFRPADDPELIDARRDYWADALAEHVQKVVSEAPPLTEQQIGRIVSILTRGPDTR